MQEIAWQAQGSGPPLVMVNGYAASGADWDPTLLGDLARDFTVICPDNRGFGDSPPVAGALTVAGMARDLLGVLDALGAERAALAGWSMGGFIAQELAATHPERVGGLVLLATDPGGEGAVRAEPAAAARLFDHGGSPREQASRMISLLFPEPIAAQVDAEFGEQVAGARAALAEPALFAQEEAMGAWYAEPAQGRLAAIRPPVLVMAGELDVVIPPANSAALAAALPGSRLETFPGAGHAFIAQEAPAVARSIERFLTGTRPSVD